MIKSDKGKKVLGLIVILAIIVSVFGGVVSAVDLSGVTQSVTDVEIQTEVGDLSSEELTEALDAVTDDTVNIEFADRSAELGLVSSRSSYDPQAAVIYSDTWWDGRNPSYHDYSYVGGDCANFVSQCLIAGGLDLTVFPDTDGYGCIPSCDNLHTYLTDYLGAQHQLVVSRSETDQPLWFLPGDVAIFGDSSDNWRHAVFCVTGDDQNYATCNAHSQNLHQVNIQQFFNANPSWTLCNYYQVSGEINQPPTALASDISGQPEIMHPDTLYEVTSKYYDPDGRANLYLCTLGLTHHPSDNLVMGWGENLKLPIEDSPYITYLDVDYTLITGSYEGYQLTWKFKLSDTWPEAENCIDFCVVATDDDSLQSEWDCDNTDASFVVIVPTCDGTATSCGIYPNCENCNEDDGCYAYSNGCEERNYYCVSNEAGCGHTYSNRHTDYYDDWDYYCDGDTVRKHRLLHNYYCDGGTCTDHTSLVDDQLVENCNDYDGWYCNGNTREYRDFYCSGSSCTYTVTSSDNCDNYDGWVDTGNTRWEDVNECQEKEQKEQEYRDYACSNGVCTYSVTDTQWLDTGNTQNKPDGTDCGSDGWVDTGNTRWEDVNECQEKEQKEQEYRDYACSNGVCTYSVTDTQWLDTGNTQNKPDGTDCGSDGWVDTGNTRWEDVNECKEKEQKEQEYRDYACSNGVCTYSVTNTQWVDTGNTRNKPDGTICGCNASNTLKSCYGGVCTDTGICNSTNCDADAACDGKEPGDSCSGGRCNSTCKCVSVCGNMAVDLASWSPTLNCGDSDSRIVTVSATGGVVEGVTVSKISGETWLTLSQTNLGDIPSGSSKTFTVTAAPPAGTSSGYYPYTIRVSNTCGTPSSRDVSGTIHVECPDTTPPSAVTDLATTDPTSKSIKLTWTAPGDDGDTGTATTYGIRYLEGTPITESDWASAIQCADEPSPNPAGSAEAFVVTDLSPDTTYYFALKTADEVPNWSPISNSPSGTTKGAAIAATREISPQQVMNGSTFTVTVTIIANQDIYAPILDEDPPTGWSVTSVQNDGATFKESEIKWLWTESLSKGDSKTVIYNVTVPSDTEPKDYMLTGNVSAYGIEPITVGGGSTITVITDWNPWDDDGIITDSEIQEAVYCWLTDTPKNGHLVTDEEIQTLVYMWLTG